MGRDMKQKISSPLALLVLLGAAWCLSGCGHPPSTAGVTPDADFLALDTNGDGHLTLAESKLSPLEFQALDQNGDGSIDILEWSGGRDDAGTATRVQQWITEERAIRDPHANGSTMRGAFGP
jgi:hypothetical protein